MSLSDPVTRGVALALTAEREGLLDEHGLTAVLTYYERQGRRGRLTPEQVLCDLGGLDPAALNQVVRSTPVALSLGPRPFAERLQLLGSLGEGGMGTVYRAYDRILRRVVALKLIRNDRLGPNTKRVLQRFEREAQVMARIRHPNCVAIYSAGELRGQPFLIMEYVRGESLEARIEREGPQDPRQVATWGRDLAWALDSCHAVGVVHRDVKPANVLLDSAGQPRLTDFGIALDRDARTKLTAESGAIGTLAYMPPEQALGKPADPRADLYSLGASLFEALTGRLVHDTDQPLLLLHQITSEPAPKVDQLRAEVPLDLSRVVAKCLEKNREDRYESCTALVSDLEAFLAGAPVRARPLGRVHRGVRWVRQRRYKLAAGLFGGLVILGLWLAVRAIGQQRRVEQEWTALASAVSIEDPEVAVATITSLATTVSSPKVALQALSDLAQAKHRALLVRCGAALDQLEIVQSEARSVALELARLDVSGAYYQPGYTRLKQEYSRSSRRWEQLKAERSEVVGQLRALISQAEALIPESPGRLRLEAQYLVAAAQGADFDTEVSLKSQAADIYISLGEALPEELSDPVLLLNSEGAPLCRIGRIELGEEGCWSVDQLEPLPIGERRRFPPGRYLLTATWSDAPTHEVRHPVVLRYGPAHLISIPRPYLVGRRWAWEEFAYVSQGQTPIVGRIFGPQEESLEVEDFYAARRETSVAAWYSYRCGLGWPPAGQIPFGHRGLAEQGVLPGDVGDSPASGLTEEDASKYLGWLRGEMVRARVPLNLGLPDERLFARTVRGPFRWVFPWGPEFDIGHVVHGRAPKRGQAVRDVSVFGVEDLVGSVSELVRLPPEARVEGEYATIGASSLDYRQRVEVFLTAAATIPTGSRSTSVGVRVYALDGILPDLHQNPELCAAKKAEALQLVQLTDYLGTIRVAGEAIDADPLDIQAWQIRAEARRALEDFWGVNFDAHRMVELDPSYVHGWTLMGIAQEQRGKLDRALQAWDKALELAPQATDGYRMRARVKGKLGDVAGALEDLRTFEANAPADFPTRPDAAALRAELEAKRGE